MPKAEWSFFMPAEDHQSVKKFITYCQSRLTPWGIIIFLIAIIGSAISSVGTHISAYLLPSFILALMITSYLLSFFFRPKVTATRILPPSNVAGSYSIYTVQIKNISKRTIRNLSIFEQTLPYGLYSAYTHENFSNHIDWLDPETTKTITLVLRTPRRGFFKLGKLIAGSSFPSGIFRSRVKTGQPEKFIVYPKQTQYENVPLNLKQYFQPGGISVGAKTGHSNEFASTREYRQGDRTRDIHWTSSARIGKLIVKEYIEEYIVRVGLFVDTQLRRYQKHKYLEGRISLCAGIADKLNNGDCIIDLFLNDKHHQHAQTGRGSGHFNHMLELLSAIEGAPNVDFIPSVAQLKKHASQLSLLIIFLEDWDPKRKTFVNLLKELNINTKIIVIKDKPTILQSSDENIAIYSTLDLIKLNA